jgi:hypothetical protein
LPATVPQLPIWGNVHLATAQLAHTSLPHQLRYLLPQTTPPGSEATPERAQARQTAHHGSSSLDEPSYGNAASAEAGAVPARSVSAAELATAQRNVEYLHLRASAWLLRMKGSLWEGLQRGLEAREAGREPGNAALKSVTLLLILISNSALIKAPVTSIGTGSGLAPGKHGTLLRQHGCNGGSTYAVLVSVLVSGHMSRTLQSCDCSVVQVLLCSCTHGSFHTDQAAYLAGFKAQQTSRLAARRLCQRRPVLRPLFGVNTWIMAGLRTYL